MNRIFKQTSLLTVLLISAGIFASEQSEELNLAILISGTGSNMAAILDKNIKGVKPCIVISNRKDAAGLQKAQERGVPTAHVPKMRTESRDVYCQKLIDCLKQNNVTPENGLICLAGFMLLLDSNIVKEYPNRIMNIHPSLLPFFKGAHAISDAFEASATETGPTVHFVDNGMDTGAIILQESFPVEKTDALEDVERKMHKAEHRIFPKAVKLFAQNRLQINGQRVTILPPDDSD